MQQDEELVAPQADDDVALPDVIFKQTGNGDQQLVADVMSERIVDLLETIKVDQHYGDRLPWPASAQVIVADALEAAPVEQAGQRVLFGDPVRLV